MATRNVELYQQCVILRTVDRMSLKEIENLTEVSRGTLSTWLRDYPLTKDEKQKRLARARTKAASILRKDKGKESKYYQAVKHKRITTAAKGKIAEAAVLFRLCLHGFNAYGSPFDGDRIDWVVERENTGRHYNIQVKWATRCKQGLPVVSLRRNMGRKKHRRYGDRDFDFLIGYDLFTDIAYVWSRDELKHIKNLVTVTTDAAERWDKLK